jgi:mono/diheme cytochrome c family protein
MTLGSTMPIFSLAREQARAITIYLLTARGGTDAVNDVRYLARNSAAPKPDTPLFAPTPLAAPILFFRYDGQQLFWGAGCGVCHRIGTEGGAVGPALTHIGRVREPDWLRRYLRDPSAVRPDGRMPQLYLNDREIDALIAFLVTLK